MGKKGGQCVVFARSFSGLGRDKVSGWARNNKVTTRDPALGSVLRTRESYAGHVAVVVAIQDNQIEVVESNYHWNQRVSMRWINKNSPKIVGYIR